MSRGKDDAARVDESKLEAFLDFVARMIARRWIQEQRTQEKKSPGEQDAISDETSNAPEVEPDE